MYLTYNLNVSFYRIYFQIRDNILKYINYTSLLPEEGNTLTTIVRNQIIF